MITIEQIKAENFTVALDADQELALSQLVKSYKYYRDNIGRYPKFAVKLSAERATPTVKTKGLKAILTALSLSPNIVVESELEKESPGLYTSKSNWEEFAQDVLNILYEVEETGGNSNSYFLVRKTIADLLQCERTPFIH